jgi:hypothetical protein
MNPASIKPLVSSSDLDKFDVRRVLIAGSTSRMAAQHCRFRLFRPSLVRTGVMYLQTIAWTPLTTVGYAEKVRTQFHSLRHATAPPVPIFRIDSRINELSPGKLRFLIVGSEEGSSATTLFPSLSHCSNRQQNQRVAR